MESRCAFRSNEVFASLRAAMIPPVMRLFRNHNPIVLTLSHLRSGAVACGMASAFVLLAATPAARADFLIDYGSTVVWNGGIAVDTGSGWFGQGWDRFPGVNPPWNPVNRGFGVGLGGGLGDGFGDGLGGSLNGGFGIGRSYRAPSARPMPMPEVRVVVVPVREPRPVRPLSLSFNGEDVPLSGCGCGW